MTDFCGIPLVSLRENSITKLYLQDRGVGEPGAIVLSKLLPFAAALTSLECAAATQRVCLFVSAPVDTSQHQACLLTRARSLDRNDLGPEGGAALAEGLKGNSTLQVLE